MYFMWRRKGCMQNFDRETSWEKNTYRSLAGKLLGKLSRRLPHRRWQNNIEIYAGANRLCGWELD
jgi:hypothetical protein